MEESKYVFWIIGILTAIISYFLKSNHKEYTEGVKKIKSTIDTLNLEVSQIKTRQHSNEEYTRREIENIRELIDIKLDGVTKEVKSGLDKVITIVEQKNK